MHRGGRATVAVFGCLLVTAALGVRALAQASFTTPYQTTDFSGEWWAVGNDVPFAGRMPFEVGYTAELYDYSGLPYNDAGRARRCRGHFRLVDSGVRLPPRLLGPEAFAVLDRPLVEFLAGSHSFRSRDHWRATFAWPTHKEDAHQRPAVAEA